MPASVQPDLPARLLVIERKAGLADAVAGGSGAYRMDQATSGREGISALQQTDYDIVLADLESLTDLDASTENAVGRLARLGKAALLLVVTTTESVSAAVEALRAGAHDCIAKPLIAEDFEARIAALRTRHDRRGIMQPIAHTSVSGPTRLVAHAPRMQVVLEHLARIASSSAPVLLSGEKGTGKRLSAETLHALGPQADQPFIAVNCARNHPVRSGTEHDDGLSQLAGVDGARALARAGGGTLYLHEIDALDASAQARLFSFVEPDPPTLLRLRIVCSTRKSPSGLLHEKSLRRDLFYRLNVLPIHLPPLRQRPEDIAPLASHFLRGFARAAGRRFTGFAPGAIAYLDAHEWPGNIRQLETLVRHVVAMFDGITVTPQMLAAADIDNQSMAGMTGGATVAALDIEDKILPMWQQEQRIIEVAISRHGGNIAKAAAALEISPSTIYRKKQTWEERTGKLAGAA